MMGEVKLTFLGAFQGLFCLESGGAPVGGAGGGGGGRRRAGGRHCVFGL